MWRAVIRILDFLIAAYIHVASNLGVLHWAAVYSMPYSRLGATDYANLITTFPLLACIVGACFSLPYRQRVQGAARWNWLTLPRSLRAVLVTVAALGVFEAVCHAFDPTEVVSLQFRNTDDLYTASDVAATLPFQTTVLANGRGIQVYFIRTSDPALQKERSSMLRMRMLEAGLRNSE